MKYTILCLFTSILVISGCTMFTSWKSIPPPGGCDQCHTVPINANWQATYQTASISDERGRLAFQTPEYNQPSLGGQKSPLEQKKVEGQACFNCHRTPTLAHKGRKGRFHH